MDDIPDLQFGDVFCGYKQTLQVNVVAPIPDPEKWQWVKGVTIDNGHWEIGYLRASLADETAVVGPFLTRINVGLDGRGEVTIYKNVSHLDRHVPGVPRNEKPQSWD
jgi:hypothetical protein